MAIVAPRLIADPDTQHIDFGGAHAAAQHIEFIEIVRRAYANAVIGLVIDGHVAEWGALVAVEDYRGRRGAGLADFDRKRQFSQLVWVAELGLDAVLRDYVQARGGDIGRAN